MTDLAAQARDVLAAAENAMPGPWTVLEGETTWAIIPPDGYREVPVVATDAGVIDEPDAAFIALTRTAAPALARTVERLHSDEAVDVAGLAISRWSRGSDRVRAEDHALANVALTALLAWAETPDSSEETTCQGESVTCHTTSHEHIPATTRGFYDDGTGPQPAAYCAACTEQMVGAKEYRVKEEL